MIPFRNRKKECKIDRACIMTQSIPNNFFLGQVMEKPQEDDQERPFSKTWKRNRLGVVLNEDEDEKRDVAISTR